MAAEAIAPRGSDARLTMRFLLLGLSLRLVSLALAMLLHLPYGWAKDVESDRKNSEAHRHYSLIPLSEDAKPEPIVRQAQQAHCKRDPDNDSLRCQ